MRIRVSPQAIFAKNNFVFYFSTFKPVVIYKNSLLNKSNVFKENKSKSGIYRWVNIKNNISYIKGPVDLYYRLLSYYSINYLNKILLIMNSYIKSCCYMAMINLI